VGASWLRRSAAGYDAPPLAVLHTQPPALLEEDGNLPALIDTDLAQWLHPLQLDEFEPTLRELSHTTLRPALRKTMLPRSCWRNRASSLCASAAYSTKPTRFVRFVLPVTISWPLLLSCLARLFSCSFVCYSIVCCSCKSAATDALVGPFPQNEKSKLEPGGGGSRFTHYYY
jgi:hypothetical protein